MLPIIFSSGVVVGLVGALVTLRTTERKISIENITQQRKLWRDTVREKALEVVQAYNNNDNSRIKELGMVTK